MDRIYHPSLRSYSETLKISKAHEDVSGADAWQAELARAQFAEPLIAGGDRVVEGGGFLRKPLSRGERMERHKNQCRCRFASFEDPFLEARVVLRAQGGERN